MKLIFTPISIVLGLVAGMVGQKVFEKLWSLADDQEPPRPEQREFSWPKLVAALLIEGAVFRLVKGLADHGARRGFARATGTWPGDEAPEADQRCTGASVAVPGLARVESGSRRTARAVEFATASPCR